MFNEFKKFIKRGNVLDLAIGVVIGASFGKIVGSLVDDIFMPVLGLIVKQVDFSDLFINLSPGKGDFATVAAAKAAGASTLNYGMFGNNVVQFLIVAFAIFMLMKAVNRFMEKPAPASPDTKDCPFCTTKIPIKATRCPHCTSQLA
jgi:large conductance mechanosensitive channel